MEKLKAGIRESYRSSRYNLNKGSARSPCWTKLVKMVEFELPPSMVDVQARTLLADMRARHGNARARAWIPWARPKKNC